MILGLTLIALAAFLGVMSHRRTKLENKLLKNIPLYDLLTITILPFLVYFGIWLIIRSVVSRSAREIFPFDDMDIIGAFVLFVVGSFTGNAIHFSSKVLWRYIPQQKARMAYRVNEMFHNKVSHYLVFTNGLLGMFLLGLLEINHPWPQRIEDWMLTIVIAIGVLSGWSLKRGIFYTNQWFGGYNKPMFFLIFILFAALGKVFSFYHLSFNRYPAALSIYSMYGSFLFFFLMGQIFIFTRLNNKRKLRFLTKIFSAY